MISEILLIEKEKKALLRISDSSLIQSKKVVGKIQLQSSMYYLVSWIWKKKLKIPNVTKIMIGYRHLNKCKLNNCYFLIYVIFITSLSKTIIFDFIINEHYYYFFYNFSDENISYSDLFEISEERLSQLIPNLEDRYLFVSRREVLYRKNSSILVSALLIVETMNI